jgi:TRAP-type mannitol/chloroaromatic compound transport system permease small subunit
MMEKVGYLRYFISFVNKLNDNVGKAFTMLIFPMILIMVGEVIARYLFNRPTIWVHELSGMLYSVYFLLGGVYALRWNAHVRVEIIYDRFSPRTKAIVDLAVWLFFYLFCVTLLVKGFAFGWSAMIIMEHSNSIWGPSVWPVKLFIPVAAFLLLLQGLTKTIKDIFTVITGRDPFSDILGEYKTKKD